MPALDKTKRKPLSRPKGRPRDSTVDPAEVARFAAMAGEWWDPGGKFAPLHRFNPTRLQLIRDRLAARAGRDPLADKPLKGVRVLDVGAGGGLIAEPLARLGADVTGIDASETNVEVARAHAKGQGLGIDYRFASAADLAKKRERFDAVLSLEVVEHVADRRAFVADCAGLVAPGGVLILATLNRTAKSFLFGVVAAEYVLRWLPRGTHDWRRFVRPSELAADLRAAGMKITELAGVGYNPITDRFSLGPDIDVNYMAVAERG
ncbi:MAG: bifunctional 2-polyprenyl-6-hydroxyphenol methylase/3-demethylubiquinol 3-O-methyltransferase UbiG [Rhodospirillales bacterium]